VTRLLKSAADDPALFFGPPRRVLMISPQPWDGLKVSKHHYATELAALGHKVHFLEPPNGRGRPGVISIEETDAPGIERVSHTPLVPYELKFHARSVFDWAMRLQARRIAAQLGGRPDVVWDFDNSYQFSDLSAFGAPLRIFHTVDNPAQGRSSAKGANLVLSVSQAFLDRLAPVQGHVIPHALSAFHMAHARDVAHNPQRAARPGRPLRVGYVGNLEHIGVDWPTILTMVQENPGARFRFTGPTAPDASSRVPLPELRACGNVELTGPQTAQQVLACADEIDIWLVCYDGAKTVDGAINSHKILEYLATGNPVVCNRVAAYADCDLVEMSTELSNGEMPALLRSAIARLPVLHSPAARRRRAQFAAGFSYADNLRRIDTLARAAVMPLSLAETRA